VREGIAGQPRMVAHRIDGESVWKTTPMKNAHPIDWQRRQVLSSPIRRSAYGKYDSSARRPWLTI
jgi:hypothetical protein